MKKNGLIFLTTTLFLSNIAYSEEGHWDILKKSNEAVQEGSAQFSQEKSLLAQVRQVYDNYKDSHPLCGYQDDPYVFIYPVTAYTLTNPYTHGKNEINSIRFKMRNFVIDGPMGDVGLDPACGRLSIKCGAYDDLFGRFYCERIHDGLKSEPAKLSDPRYDNYIAYQTIYNLSVIPKAQRNFGLLKQFYPLEPFSPYSSSQIPNPNYEYNAVIFSTFDYPDPTTPPSPNYNNGDYGFLFLGSAENLKSVCHSIQYDNLSPEDAAVRFSEFLGIPPDSPDVTRKFTFFKLRNNPHVSGQKDGNMFRPCPADGSIESLFCSVSALTIPHNCNNPPPPPYDGTTVSSFLVNQFYGSYCNTNPNKSSGAVVHFPWTGQGFTYDWYPWHVYYNSKNVQGGSEYVPATNSGGNNIEVVNKKSVQEFLATCDFN